MKKICIIFLLSIIISLTAFGLDGFSKNEAPMYAMNTQNYEDAGAYLRIHIRADSNEDAAQAVKYKVRDRVVEHLTPILAECETRAEAMDDLEADLPCLSAISTEILRQEGFSYQATASLTVENFPTRVYGGYTLPAGEYTALLIRLGSGAGDNWWCVAYPPLCFAATNADVVYKSKIKEIIDRFYNSAT